MPKAVLGRRGLLSATAATLFTVPLAAVLLDPIGRAFGLRSRQAEQAAAASSGSSHLAQVRALVDNLNRLGWPNRNNRYCHSGEPTVLRWGTPGKSATYRAQAQCSTFVTKLLSHTYRWADERFFRRTFGSTSPYPTDYYRVFAKGSSSRFRPIRKVAELRAGDLIAVDYSPETRTRTGHLMVVKAVKGRYTARGNIRGTTQYVVEVVDCTSTPHATPGNRETNRFPDSRIASSRKYHGVGYGHVVLYADNRTGAVWGHRWSVIASAIHPVRRRRVAMVRVAG